MNHITRLELTITTPSLQGQVYIQRTQALFHQQLRADLAELLTHWQSHFPAGLSYPRLELDLGNVPADQFEVVFSARLRQQLTQWLAQQAWQWSDNGKEVLMPTQGRSAQDDSNNTSRENSLHPPANMAETLSPDVLRQAFIRYLSQGFWPWPQHWLSVSDNASAPRKRRSAQRWLMVQWQQDSVAWKQVLWSVLVSADARERLWRLLSPPVRRRLIYMLWPQAPRGVTLSVLTQDFVHNLRHDNHPRGVQRTERDRDKTSELNASKWQDINLDGSTSFPDNESPHTGEAAETGAGRRQGDDKTSVSKQVRNGESPHTGEAAETGAGRRQGDDKRPVSKQGRNGERAHTGAMEDVISPERDVRTGPPGLPSTAPFTVVGGGGVLCWAMLPALFAQLWPQGMDGSARHQAVQLLDNLIWQDEVPAAEWRMAGLRVLCGLPPEATLPPDITLSEHQREQGADWLAAVMAQLPLLPRFSTLTEWESGTFCALFLQRPGVLSYQDNGWYWQVTPEPYDLLLLELPWPLDGFTLQSPLLPWLAAPLSVSWPLPELPHFL